jgi:hypothetical protein
MCTTVTGGNAVLRAKVVSAPIPSSIQSFLPIRRRVFGSDSRWGARSHFSRRASRSDHSGNARASDGCSGLEPSPTTWNSNSRLPPSTRGCGRRASAPSSRWPRALGHDHHISRRPPRRLGHRYRLRPARLPARGPDTGASQQSWRLDPDRRHPDDGFRPVPVADNPVHPQRERTTRPRPLGKVAVREMRGKAGAKPPFEGETPEVEEIGVGQVTRFTPQTIPPSDTWQSDCSYATFSDAQGWPQISIIQLVVIDAAGRLWVIRPDHPGSPHRVRWRWHKWPEHPPLPPPGF